MSKLFTALLAGVALAPMAAAAQSAAPENLPKVEIVAPTAAPSTGANPSGALNAAPIPAAALSTGAAASPNLADLLATVPGVSLRTGGGVSDLPIIHGFDDERNSTLLGGMAITPACPNHMNPALSYLDAGQVGTATVITSNVPVSLGGDSIGGAIIAEPRPPVFAAPASPASPLLSFGGSATVAFRSNAGSLSASGTAYAATQHFSVDWAGSLSQAGNYSAGGGAKVLSTKFEATNNALTFGYQAEGQQITVRGAYQYIPYEAFPAQDMDMLSNRAPSLSVDYKGAFSWGELSANAFYQHTLHYMNFLADKNGGTDATPSTGMPMYTDGQNFGYSVKGVVNLTKIDALRLGNEFRGETLNDWWPAVAGAAPMMGPNTFQNLNHGQRDRIGTYVEWQRQWTPQWSTLLGVRNDIVWMNTGDVQGYSDMYAADAAAFNAVGHARTDVNFDLTATARYAPNADSAYEFGYTRKTRSPTLYERYAWSTNTMASSMVNWIGDLNGYVGNLDLKPEVAHTLSFTADWKDSQRDAWELKLNPYFSYVENFIDTTVIGQASMMGSYNYLLQFTNHNAELYGFDVSGHYQLGKSSTFGVSDLTGSLSYVRGINLNPSPDAYTTYGGGTSHNLYGIQPLTAKLGLNQTLDVNGGKLTGAFEVEAVAAKSAVDTARLELKTPGYTLVNLRAAYEVKNVRFELGVENLLDKFYYLPLGGGDAINSSYGYQLPSQWVGIPGQGRDLYTSLTVKF